jgi:hypothetical protein
MSIKNYIFQVRNAIFQVLQNSEIGGQVVLNRGSEVEYPYVIIEATKKKVLENNQKELITDIQIITKDLSVVSVSNILTKIEDVLKQSALQENIDYYAVHFVDVTDSCVFPNEEGFFYGKISVVAIVDDA